VYLVYRSASTNRGSSRMVKKKKKRRSTLKICNTVILIPTSFFTRSKLMESGILSVFSSPPPSSSSHLSRSHTPLTSTTAYHYCSTVWHKLDRALFYNSPAACTYAHSHRCISPKRNSKPANHPILLLEFDSTHTSIKDSESFFSLSQLALLDNVVLSPFGLYSTSNFFPLSRVSLGILFPALTVTRSTLACHTCAKSKVG
jgi:hypothetical protein